MLQLFQQISGFRRATSDSGLAWNQQATSLTRNLKWLLYRTLYRPTDPQLCNCVSQAMHEG